MHSCGLYFVIIFDSSLAYLLEGITKRRTNHKKWKESSLNWVLELCSTLSIALICQPQAIPSQWASHPLVTHFLRQQASPATTAHIDPYFLFTRSPVSGDTLQG